MAWKVPTLARVVNNWQMNTDTMGVYGDYYLKRAIIAQVGLRATFPRTPSIRSISATRTASRSTASTNTQFTSTRVRYRLWRRCWSTTLYDPQGFPVANLLNRFAVSSWMPFKYNV